MITREARTYLKDQMKTGLGYKLGSGGDSTNPNATDLDDPIDTTYQTSITANDSGEAAIDYDITIYGSNYLGQTIKEIGIYIVASNTLLCRVNYEGIGPLTSTDEVQFVITLEVE
tara:strand:- start:30 stop:374 length:345 start_codon:yes stop_codon:yes gene_type:complete